MNKAITYLITKEFFYILTTAVIVFFVLEIIWPGVAISRINENYLLILWAVDGIVILLLNDDKKIK